MLGNRQAMRSQSAMEYMMTYGWAVLIIAVVLAVLFQLGIFSQTTFAPRAAPGSCSVYRPNGPATIQLIELSGLCSGQLPQYVAVLNGAGAYAALGNTMLMSPEAGSSGAMTLCMWYYINSLTGYNGPLLKGQGGPSGGNNWEYALDQAGGYQSFNVLTSAGAVIDTGTTGIAPVAGKWYFACFTYSYSASTGNYFVNGNLLPSTFTGGTTASAGTGNLVVGYDVGGFSNIRAANVQLYNTTLTANELSALYVEGIGGAPLVLQNLVGWWPLNGDVNDYSGDGFSGSAFNGMTFTAQWASGYTPP